ncbi:MAG: outer membrane protein assembly factor BamA [Bacteriovoracaceae bacterium]|nr:outer membrane protein assembly factor BamA [Bacteriovoracaceae bacterium]
MIRWIFFAIIFFNSCASLVHAAIDWPSTKQIVVDTITFKGLRKVEPQALLEKMTSAPNRPITPQSLSTDIKNIYNMGYFQEVEAFYDDNAGGKKTLLMKIKEKPLIRKVRFEGNDAEGEDELKKVVKSKEFTIVDIKLVKSDAQAIQKFYEDKGYFLADVSYEIKDAGNESNEVIFKIMENGQVKVKAVTFLGNKELPDDDLKKFMMTKEDSIMGAVGSAGTFREFNFQADVERLGYYYRTKGFLQANIFNPLVTVSDDKRWIFITIQVEEGPKFSVNSIEFQGDLIFTDAELREKLQLIEGQTYNEETLRQDILMLTEKYQDEGYAFANVLRTLEPVEGENKVNIKYSFEKGKKAYFGKVSVKGNSKTRDKVIRRELKIYEGMLYSGTKLRESKENVNRLGFFDKDSVIFNTVSPKGKDDVLDLEISVKERQTGQITLGAGYSSATRGFLQASIRQNNFRGLGQDLNFSLNLGSQQQTYSLGFTEPYFLDTRWLLGGMVYRTVSQFIRSFDYERTGFELRVGHPVYDYTRFFTTYSFKDTQLQNVRNPTIDRNVESGIGSSVEFSLVTDKRNNSFEPSSGYWTSGGLEYVGLGGDFRWLKSEIEARYFKKLFADLVMRTRVRHQRLYKYGVTFPRTEKFAMGGPRNMRGFGNEGIGPRERRVDNDGFAGFFNTGGLESVLGTLELENPLVEEAGLKWVAFYDVGNVYKESYRNSETSPHLRSNYGLGMRWFSPIGILRFELGFPIAKKQDEAASQFFFDIGQNF